jgi:hypothetical protein
MQSWDPGNFLVSKSRIVAAPGFWYQNEPFEFESDNKTAEVEINLQLSLQKKLARGIDKEMNF